MVTKQGPSLDLEGRLWAKGYCCVTGLDEAGRGAWAGPVVAAAVALPPRDPDLLHDLSGVRDSKQLTSRRREALLEVVQQRALAWGFGSVPASEVDKVGIVPATRLAMNLALQSLPSRPDHLLIDHLSLLDVALPQTSLAKGDARVLSIAAASIVAKVHRDELLVRLAGRHPLWQWERNKGYASRGHRQALEKHGQSYLHRRSFAVAPVLP